LVRNILAIVDREKPLHLSLVGGYPLVRYREVELLLSQLERRGIHTQIVTSAFRVIPIEWNKFSRLSIVVSIDGLQADHDERRKPATYERILKNIAGTKVTIHSTITGNIAARPGYLDEFLKFWSSRPEINKVWFSLFTPQRGAVSPEILTPEKRAFIVTDLLRLRANADCLRECFKARILELSSVINELERLIS
jgi:sulfatase maturation enzyme AslB (radical SAM superfamily)